MSAVGQREPSRLRVGVPAALDATPTSSGRGRMWREVLSHLAADVDLHFIARPGTRRFGAQKVDVWLADGHEGPLAVRQPQVVQFHEAPWYDPDTLATCDPAFLEVRVPSEQSARVAAAVICPSEWSKRQIIASYGLDPSRVVVAPHGVDAAVFHPEVPGGPDIVASRGGLCDEPYVLFVSTVHPRKNLLALRGAMLELARRGLKPQLVIVGGPAYGRSDHEELFREATAELQDLPGKLVTVPFGLADGDLAALMAGAAVFCLPSLSEGFGLPALEAMACGTPTVVADRGALPEVTGDAAIRVGVDAASIADGLEAVLSSTDVARRLSDDGVARARSFTWERCADAWRRALLLGAGREQPALGSTAAMARAAMKGLS